MVQHVLTTMNEVVTNGYSQSHKALDIVGQNNTVSDVIALEDGTVETVVKNVTGRNNNTKGLATYGNYIKINQTNGKKALYAHLKYGSVTVNKGQFVTKGTVIGIMGETGNAYGKHLHLEIQTDSGKENPIISLSAESPKQEEQITNENNEIKKEEKTNEINNEQKPNNENFINKEVENKNTISNKTINEENTKSNEYLANQNYNYGSIVDALKEINIDSSYAYREKLAQKNGITNYQGTYSQNVKLLNLLKNGQLKKA